MRGFGSMERSRLEKKLQLIFGDFQIVCFLTESGQRVRLAKRQRSKSQEYFFGVDLYRLKSVQNT